MEHKGIKKIITATGNISINNNLKKIINIKVINFDILYKEGIIEFLEKNKYIDFIIIDFNLPGKLKNNDLINKIKVINPKIKIIFIINKNNKEKICKTQNIKYIYNDEQIETNIKNILFYKNQFIKKEIIEDEIIEDKTILNKYKNKIVNEILNQINIILNKYKKNNYCANIVTVLGTGGVGKSVFTINLAKTINFKKILIIDFDILNNSLHTILGIKKYQNKKTINFEDLIIKVDKKIDIISEVSMFMNSENQINEFKIKNFLDIYVNKYNLIIIDTSSNNYINYLKELIESSSISFFLVEPNLLEIKKSKILLEKYLNEWKISKDKIKIIFNKVNNNSIDKQLLKKIFIDFKIIGNIKLNKNYNLIINNNKFKNFKKLKKEYNKINYNI